MIAQGFVYAWLDNEITKWSSASRYFVPGVLVFLVDLALWIYYLVF